MHFITQTTPNIWRKFQKLEAGPQIPQSTLVEEAFKVSNNQDLTEEAVGAQGTKNQDNPEGPPNMGPESTTARPSHHVATVAEFLSPPGQHGLYLFYPI